MKIQVESEKIVKALKKLEGVELVLESPGDAMEALSLIVSKARLTGGEGSISPVKEVKVTSLQKYETSAVNYKLVFLLEFLFTETTPVEERVATVKRIQDFFNKA